MATGTANFYHPGSARLTAPSDEGLFAKFYIAVLRFRPEDL